MSYYPLRKNEVPFHFIKLNVVINCPSIFYIFVFSWRWPSWPKHVAMINQY